jgi:hypothetical protein
MLLLFPSAKGNHEERQAVSIAELWLWVQPLLFQGSYKKYPIYMCTFEAFKKSSEV